MKALAEQYDWIILGAHPAALWASLSLLESGSTVLVVPNLGLPKILPNTPLHLHESNWCPDFLAPEPQDVIQVLTAQKRLRIEHAEIDFQREWKSVLGNLPTPANITKGMDFVYRGHDLCSTPAEDWKRVLLKIREQRYYPSGKAGLRRSLLERVAQKGGRVLDDERCQQIFVEKKGFKGIQLQGVSKMIAGSAALLCEHWEAAQPLFSQPSTAKSDPQGWWFTFQFQIPPEMLPLGVTRKMIFADERAPSVEIEKKGETWTARTLLPYQEQSLQREFQRKIAQRLFKLIEGIFPFVEYAASDLIPDLKDPERVESYELVQLYPFRDLAQIPPSLLAFGGKGLGHSTEFPGFYFASPASYPQHGEWGIYHAAASSMMDWAKKLQKVLPDELKKVVISPS